MEQGPKKTICILVPDELYQKLSEQAEQESRSMSAYIRQVLRAHMEYIGRFRR